MLEALLCWPFVHYLSMCTAEPILRWVEHNIGEEAALLKTLHMFLPSAGRLWRLQEWIKEREEGREGGREGGRRIKIDAGH